MDYKNILEILIKLATEKGGVDKITSEELEKIVSPQDTSADFMDKFKSLFTRSPKADEPKNTYTFDEMQNEVKKVYELLGGEIKSLKDMFGEQVNKSKAYEEEMKKRVDSENKAKIKTFLEKAVADGKLATEEGLYSEESGKTGKYQALLEKDFDAWKSEIEARKSVTTAKSGQSAGNEGQSQENAKPSLGMVKSNFLEYVKKAEN